MVKNFDHDHGQNFSFNHGQMVKISTMTTAKIQIFHGQNGQPKILPRNLTKKHQFWPWPWTKYKFFMVKTVNRWSNHEVWPQNNHVWLFNGLMVKISTMTTAKIQIFHGKNGQPKNFTTKFVTKKYPFWPWSWPKYEFPMVKMVNLWFNHKFWPQNNHFDHWPCGRFQAVSGHGQIFWPLTMGKIPRCHCHGQCLTHPPPN